MKQQIFLAQNYIGLGIINTQHGYVILNHVLKQGKKIEYGIIITDDDARLNTCCSFWGKDNWWSSPKLKQCLKKAFKNFYTDVFYVDKLYNKYSIPFIYVPSFDDETAKLIKYTIADAALLLEAPIIQGQILNALPGGIVNFHSAPLPEYRGNFTTYWTLYHNEPLFLTAHLVNHGVDTGPILMQQSIPVYLKDTLADINNRAIDVAAEVALKIMDKSLYGIPLKPQQTWEGRLFKGTMPIDIIQECERRIQAGEYGFYTED